MQVIILTSHFPHYQDNPGITLYREYTLNR